jgi:hypothetical protein
MTEFDQTRHTIISKYQFGFKENQGTENAVYCLITRILDSLNKKKKSAGFFVDLERPLTVLVMKYY